MKKLIPITLCFSLVLSTAAMKAEEDINILAEQTDELYRPGVGAQDGAYTSLGLSMLGWGLGLAAGIGLLAALLHQSTGSSQHESCNANNH
jgi:hypothetical protein